jgi:hypothetical protein
VRCGGWDMSPHAAADEQVDFGVCVGGGARARASALRGGPRPRPRSRTQTSRPPRLRSWNLTHDWHSCFTDSRNAYHTPRLRTSISRIPPCCPNKKTRRTPSQAKHSGHRSRVPTFSSCHDSTARITCTPPSDGRAAIPNATTACAEDACEPQRAHDAAGGQTEGVCLCTTEARRGCVRRARACSNEYVCFHRERAHLVAYDAARLGIAR